MSCLTIVGRLLLFARKLWLRRRWQRCSHRKSKLNTLGLLPGLVLVSGLLALIGRTTVSSSSSNDDQIASLQRVLDDHKCLSRCLVPHIVLRCRFRGEQVGVVGELGEKIITRTRRRRVCLIVALMIDD